MFYLDRQVNEVQRGFLLRIAVFAGIPFLLLGIFSIVVNEFSTDTNPHVSGWGLLIITLGVSIIIDGANGQHFAEKIKNIIEKILIDWNPK